MSWLPIQYKIVCSCNQWHNSLLLIISVLLYIPSMATVYSLLPVIVYLLYILIVDICSATIACSLRVLMVVVHLLYISIVNIYSMATVSTCKYCWQQVRRCDYEEHIGRSCPHLPMECVLECGEYIARKMMKQHCQQQCNNAEKILSQKQDDECVILYIAEQETNQH